MNNQEWIRIRMKMLKNEVTFSSIAEKFGLSRQRVHTIIKKSYPAKGRTKKVLDDFYTRIS